MANYSIKQCSVCHRVKTILQDQVHVSPNECIITKGCSGFLFPIGQTTVFTPTPPVDGLTDWYPRGQKPAVVPAIPAEKTIDLSCSSKGILTIGLNVMADTSHPPPSGFSALFSQQLTQDVSYNEFVFRIQAATTVVSGQDSTGKNLRFSTASVVAGLVFVLVNGVASFPGTAANGWTAGVANRITFNSSLVAGSVVTVSIYSQPPTFTVVLNFILNQNLTPNSNSGAWGNIRWAEEYDPTTGQLKGSKWWLYTCSATDLLSASSRLSFLGTYTDTTLSTRLLPTSSVPTDFSAIRFFLASPPYDNTDRYLNFYVDGSAIGNEYALLTSTSSITELFADSSALVEMYPPFQLIENSSVALSSFIIPDKFSTTDAVPATTPESLLVGTKILGPV
jgi:hypothetical protein